MEKKLKIEAGNNQRAEGMNNFSSGQWGIIKGFNNEVM